MGVLVCQKKKLSLTDMKIIISFMVVFKIVIIYFRYNGKHDDTLTTLRYIKWNEAVMVSEDINPEDLPPTQGAANYHALWVHWQVNQWKQLDLKCLNPLNMGWKLTGGCLKPIKTEVNAAPDFILNAVTLIDVNAKWPLGTRVGQWLSPVKRMS